MGAYLWSSLCYVSGSSKKHQHISSLIDRELGELFEECEECEVLLPVDWKIDENTIVQPDNLVVCNEDGEEYIKKAPIIIFEVLSKSTAKKGYFIKYNLYEQNGVKYYIIVDPNDKIAKVFELKNGKYIKKCDCTKEKVVFEFEECGEKEFDFSKIFRV